MHVPFVTLVQIRPVNVGLREREEIFSDPWTRRYKTGDIRLNMPSSFYWDRSDGEYRVKSEQTFSVPLRQIRQ